MAMFINAFSLSLSQGMASFAQLRKGKISLPFLNWLMAHLSSTPTQRMVRFFTHTLKFLFFVSICEECISNCYRGIH